MTINKKDINKTTSGLILGPPVSSSRKVTKPIPVGGNREESLLFFDLLFLLIALLKVVKIRNI